MSDDLRKPFKIEYTGTRVSRLTGKEALVGKIEFDGCGYSSMTPRSLKRSVSTSCQSASSRCSPIARSDAMMGIKTLYLILTLTFHMTGGHHAKYVWHIYQSHIETGACPARAYELLHYARRRTVLRARVEGAFECRDEETVAS
jgi:hypothetical protein